MRHRRDCLSAHWCALHRCPVSIRCLSAWREVSSCAVAQPDGRPLGALSCHATSFHGVRAAALHDVWRAAVHPSAGSRPVRQCGLSRIRRGRGWSWSAVGRDSQARLPERCDVAERLCLEGQRGISITSVPGQCRVRVKVSRLQDGSVPS